MTAAIYVRWSTEDQGTGTTLEVQRDACLKYAADKGWSVAPEHIFIDDGISGAKERRPALDKLNHAIGQGAISTVIVFKLDHLARSPYLAYKLVENDWHKKASVVSITESHIDTTTTTGQLGFGIAAIFAAHERNTIRDRTMSGKRRRAEEGRNPGLRPPYGYAVVDKQYVLVEHEAAIVCQLYDDYRQAGVDQAWSYVAPPLDLLPERVRVLPTEAQDGLPELGTNCATRRGHGPRCARKFSQSPAPRWSIASRGVKLREVSSLVIREKASGNLADSRSAPPGRRAIPGTQGRRPDIRLPTGDLAQENESSGQFVGPVAKWRFQLCERQRLSPPGSPLSFWLSWTSAW